MARAFSRDIAVEGIDFGSLLSLEVLQHGWPVKFVRTVFLNNGDGIVIGERDVLCVYEGNRFLNDPSLESEQFGNFLNVSRTQTRDCAERVNSAVMDELRPYCCDNIVYRLGVHARRLQQFRQPAKTRRMRAVKLSDIGGSIVGVANGSRTLQITALKAQAREDARDAQRFGKYFDIADAVLQREAVAGILQYGLCRSGRFASGISVDAHENGIGFGQPGDVGGGTRQHSEIAGQSGYMKPAGFYGRHMLRPDVKKSDFLTNARKIPAVNGAHITCANDNELHAVDNNQTPELAASNERHPGRHYRHELDVCIQGQTCHIKDRFGDVLHVHSGLNGGATVRLSHPGFH